MSVERFSAFAAAAPGLAPLVADELRALHIVPTEVEPGGVAFEATADKLWAANLWLRTASRVVVRVASFRATAFHELEREARQVPWERTTDASRPVRLRVTCRKSRLYHSDAVAERVAAAIARRVGGVVDWAGLSAGADDEEESGEPDASRAQLFTVRFVHDVCTISADASGALLHRRGYREALARAPLRETLAAAMLLAAQWDGRSPLVDPLCGSGTIAIEAALLARRIPPGRHRRFAFMDWPGFDAARWQGLLDRADEEMLAAAPAPIHASDRDAGAVQATTENAERAGVAADVQVERRSLSGLPSSAGRGLVATNPPYGKRLGDSDALGTLYARFGDVLRTQCPNWAVVMLSADDRLARRTGLGWRERLRTTNGGIPVKLLSAEVPNDGYVSRPANESEERESASSA